MKKRFFNLGKSASLVSLPAIIAGASLPAIYVTTKLLQDDNARRIIPDNYFKIDEKTNTLLGFADFVTSNMLRKGRFDTLVIPRDVKKIAPYAFAYMFDGNANGIKTLQLNLNLQSIGQGAFFRCYGLQTILNLELCYDLVSIEQDAFHYCKGLNGTLVFPPYLQTIGSWAFSNCELLQSISIPDTVAKIGDYAFNHCVSVSDIIIDGDGSKPLWAGQKSYAFDEVGDSSEVEKTVWIMNLNTPTEDIEELLKNNLKLNCSTDPDVEGVFHFTAFISELNEECFDLDSTGQTLKGLKEDIKIEDFLPFSAIKIPESVKTISEGAFKNKFPLDEFGYPTCRLILNDGLETIGASAFEGCEGIFGELHIPDTVTAIGKSAFQGTRISGTLALPANSKYVKVEEKTFQNTRIKKLVIPSQFQFSSQADPFGPSAFANCTFLDCVDVSSFDPQKTYRWKRFQGTSPFSNVADKGTIFYPYLAGGTQSIDSNYESFYDVGLCSHEDTRPYWMPYTKNPDLGAFPYDVLGTRAYYINGDTLLGLRDEYKDSEMIVKFNQIKIPSEARVIGTGAFKNTFVDPTVKEDYELPSKRWELSLNFGLEEIGESAFENDLLIVGDVIIPRTVQSIKRNAFKNASGITSFKISKGIKSIGAYAFQQEVGFTSSGGTRLKYIDLTALDYNDLQYSIKLDPYALFVNNQGGTIYVNNEILRYWEEKGLKLGTGWSFKGVA